jgi:hypothetical protein
VLAVNARREGVDARVLLALRLVETLPAGEDEVGAREQLALALAERRRRALEAGEFVHAVVDGRERFEVARPSDRHRRVVPEYVLVDSLVGEESVEQLALRALRLFRAQAFGQARDDDAQLVLAAAHVEARLALAVDRLFDEVDAALAREAAQKMLRPLVDEIPTQVRKADEVNLVLSHISSFQSPRSLVSSALLRTSQTVFQNSLDTTRQTHFRPRLVASAHTSRRSGRRGSWSCSASD